jgi:shikimate dehydrogenase
MRANGRDPSRTLRLGLIGAGIEESLSPDLHEREAEALGLRCSYELRDLDALGRPPEAIGDLLAEARDDGLAGVNVTHPCKQLAVRHLDALSSEAETLGAANTVVFDHGRMTGHNTDWPGFAEGFRRGLPGAGLDAVVLVGAGGGGAAVAHAALALGVERLHVVDEDAGRAEELVAALGPRARVAGVDDLPAVLTGADGLIHATPTGMADHPGTALDPDALHPDLWVADIVYRPLATPLLEAARERGCRTLDGGRMAVFQAVYAFELFTGLEPDPDRMLAHFAELAAREGAAWTRA